MDLKEYWEKEAKPKLKHNEYIINAMFEVIKKEYPQKFYIELTKQYIKNNKLEVTKN